MAFIFPPPRRKRRRRILKTKERDLFQRLEEYVQQNEPALIRLLEATWVGQGNLLTYAQIQEAYYQGDFTGDVWLAWEQLYSEMILEKMLPFWEAAALTAVADIAGDFSIPFLTGHEFGGEYFKEYGANLVTNMVGSQREALKMTLWELYQNQNFSSTQASYFIRPLIGLTTPQIKANARYYENTWRSMVEENPSLTAEQAQARARTLSEKYAARQHRYRAQMIARTELATFFNAGHDLAVDEAISMGMLPDMDCIWSTSANESTCDICAAMEGERVPKGKPFSNGLKFPPVHPHCGCAVMYEPREDLTEETEGGIISVDESSSQKVPIVSENDNGAMVSEPDKPVVDGEPMSPKVPDVVAPVKPMASPTNSKIQFAEAKTLAEADEFAMSRLGIPKAAYKGCDVTTANEWNKGLTDTFNRFPELKQNFMFVGECHEKNKLIKSEAIDFYTKFYQNKYPNYPEHFLEREIKAAASKYTKNRSVSRVTQAQSLRKSDDFILGQYSGITVNKDFGKNASTFVESITQQVNWKNSPAGCTSIRSVLDHEIGHQLDDLLNLRENKTIQALFDSRTTAELTQDLCAYAWDNSNKNHYSEMIAEAWSEYCNNPNPREIAQTVGQIVEKEYKNKFG